jgi:hypothetical protein
MSAAIFTDHTDQSIIDQEFMQIQDNLSFFKESDLDLTKIMIETKNVKSY